MGGSGGDGGGKGGSSGGSAPFSLAPIKGGSASSAKTKTRPYGGGPSSGDSGPEAIKGSGQSFSSGRGGGGMSPQAKQKWKDAGKYGAMGGLLAGAPGAVAGGLYGAMKKPAATGGSGELTQSQQRSRMPGRPLRGGQIPARPGSNVGRYSRPGSSILSDNYEEDDQTGGWGSDF